LAENRYVAAKLETVDSPNQLLPFEYSVYAKMQGSVVIPEIIWYGADMPLRNCDCGYDYGYDRGYGGAGAGARGEAGGGSFEEEVEEDPARDDEGVSRTAAADWYNILVMELMGASLEDLFRRCGRRFSMKTVLMLMEQMLTRLELVHAAGYVHRDVKPENFMMGSAENDMIVYLIDFGRKKYRGLSKRDLYSVHIPYRTDRKLTGTRYVSVNTHNGIEQSQRDDLEALGYVMMYFLRGKLPWQGVTAETKHEKYEKIANIKRNTSVRDLCRGYPHEFTEYFEYCLLYFEDQPDYSSLRRMFRPLLETPPPFRVPRGYPCGGLRGGSRRGPMGGATGYPKGGVAVCFFLQGTL
jgi:serine/threonine protein kinase